MKGSKSGKNAYNNRNFKPIEELTEKPNTSIFMHVKNAAGRMLGATRKGGRWHGLPEDFGEVIAWNCIYKSADEKFQKN